MWTAQKSDSRVRLTIVWCDLLQGGSFVRRRRLLRRDGHHHPVPKFRKSLYVPGFACRVLQDAPEFLDRSIKSLLEIHECLFRPKQVVQLFARNNFPGAFDEYHKDLKGLRAELQFNAPFIEFPRPWLQLVRPEMVVGNLHRHEHTLGVTLVDSALSREPLQAKISLMSHLDLQCNNTISSGVLH